MKHEQKALLCTYNIMIVRTSKNIFFKWINLSANKLIMHEANKNILSLVLQQRVQY